MTEHAIGLDIGGTKIRLGLVDRAGGLTHVHQIPTPPGGAGLLDRVRELVSRYLREHRDVAAIGVGTAGVVRAGRVVSATDLLAGWAGIDVQGVLAADTGLRVAALNDAHAAAVAEGHAGNARGCPVAVVVAIGTGVGGAVLIGGDLVTGGTGAAGSVGHVPLPGAIENRPCSCGRRDHLEAYVSGPAMEAWFAAHRGEHLNLRGIAQRARAGDPGSLACFEQAGHALGAGLAGPVATLDPDVIVITGGVGQQFDLLAGPAGRALRASVFHRGAVPPFRAARFGEDAATIGAGLYAHLVHGG